MLEAPYYMDGAEDLRFSYHEGQRRVMASRARYILLLAGLQSGKTIVGPWWMLREMKRKGPGDYLVASPTFRLLNMKCLPEYRKLFQDRLRLGRMTTNPAPIFTLSARGVEIMFGRADAPETRILFGHAQDPDSLESATARAAHLDEAGQKKFKRSSHEAILGRLSIHQGRILYTTTPYALGWLKSEVYDRAKAGDPDYDLVQFSSTMNPAFPLDEFEVMKGKLPPWKFSMRYRGRFERPAGLIYDCFSRAVHCRRLFSVPPTWPRYLGLDFGGVNTAGFFLAREPGTHRYVAYRTYRAGGRASSEHVTALLKDEPHQPRASGGSHQEQGWRDAFSAAGLPVAEPPTNDVEVGIDRVYAMLRNHPDLSRSVDDLPHNPAEPYLEVIDDLDAWLDEVESYSRELGDDDEPTEKIEQKSDYHLLDATRYICAWITHPEVELGGTTWTF